MGDIARDPEPIVFFVDALLSIHGNQSATFQNYKEVWVSVAVWRVRSSTIDQPQQDHFSIRRWKILAWNVSTWMKEFIIENKPTMLYLRHIFPFYKRYSIEC